MGKDFGNNKSGIITTALVFLMLLTAVAADGSSREADLFNKGYEYYLSYQPEKAVQEFTAFLKEFPGSSARDAALFWLGKSYMQMKNFGEARIVFSELEQKFPDSPYISHLHGEMEIISKAETSAVETPAGQPEEGKKETGSPEKQLKEERKKLRTQEKMLKDISEELDKLRVQSSEEKKKKEELQKRIAELEKKEKALVKSGENLRERENELEKELVNAVKERDSLKRRLETETKKTEDPGRTVKDTEGSARSDTSETSKGSEDLGKEIYEKDKTIARLQDRIREIEQAENRSNSGAQDLAKSVEEGDVLTGVPDEERKKAEELRVRLQELEQRDRTVSDLIKERDALRDQSEEQARQLKELQGKIGVVGTKGEAPPDTLAENKDKAHSGPAERKSGAEEAASVGEKDTAGMLEKLGIVYVPWRGKDGEENEENERLLYKKARSLNVAPDSAKLKGLVERHKLNVKQRESLERFLTVGEYVKVRLENGPGEEVVESLIVKYEEGDRYAKIVIATELQENARKGVPFEEIYDLHPDLMNHRTIPYRQLEERIKDKIRYLPQGEIGVIWSDDGYMILKPVSRKLSYDPLQDISPESRSRIESLIKEWIQELKAQKEKETP
ncbi:MAG: tetratricopeptide repeat protein [Nitrospirota bacterium]